MINTWVFTYPYLVPAFIAAFTDAHFIDTIKYKLHVYYEISILSRQRTWFDALSNQFCSTYLDKITLRDRNCCSVSVLRHELTQ